MAHRYNNLCFALKAKLLTIPWPQIWNTSRAVLLSVEAIDKMLTIYTLYVSPGPNTNISE